MVSGRLVLAITVLAATRLGAQSAGAQSGVPEGYRPPPGMCRIWIEGVPAERQPAPTDCATAVRRRPANAHVVFGDLSGSTDPVTPAMVANPGASNSSNSSNNPGGATPAAATPAPPAAAPPAAKRQAPPEPKPDTRPTFPTHPAPRPAPVPQHSPGSGQPATHVAPQSPGAKSHPPSKPPFQNRGHGGR